MTEREGILHILAGLLPTALLMRLLWHRRQVSLGNRHFWSRDLLWEMPMAVAMAIVGGGVAEMASLSGMAQHAVVGAVAWLGPRGAEGILAAWLAHRAPSAPTESEENWPC